MKKQFRLPALFVLVILPLSLAFTSVTTQAATFHPQRPSSFHPVYGWCFGSTGACNGYLENYKSPACAAGQTDEVDQEVVDDRGNIVGVLHYFDTPGPYIDYCQAAWAGFRSNLNGLEGVEAFVGHNNNQDYGGPYDTHLNAQQWDSSYMEYDFTACEIWVQGYSTLDDGSFYLKLQEFNGIKC